MTDATHSLFTYGTLQRADIQQHLFGRRLQGQPDVLEGYALAHVDIADEACAITGQTCYPILRYLGPQAQPIAGVVYTLSEAELLRADAYEGPAYRRVYLPLQSGRKAWVYVDTQDAAA
ncbi:hypothetical protein AAV94_04305 [Lampropedia cohaerens]|uniref:Gamma-glutamylcyclotransferase AIG2-like domain-containing protein n=1 Tax=Lampropedia cohaerens TaxID=1610491 RepID=A0A0U1Q1G8_9BURK|nr:gamma-glutamylcyclotransferase family protein [Lampropedia cohaerens]KKW68592.1 hypothetical protein AAV94_04305 [Lampropedia cohaerens]